MTAPHVTETRRPFSITCAVQVNIRATPETIWKILTDANDFPRWNSTVSAIDGRIAEGERLRVHAPGTKRTFTPIVEGLVPGKRMTWAGGFTPIFRGVRTFALELKDDGSTDFAMQERFSGLMLPLVKGALPDFRPIFASYANDLKKEAETESTAESNSRPPAGS